MKTFSVAPRPNMIKVTKEVLSELGQPFTGISLRAGQVILLPKTGVANTMVEVHPTRSSRMAVHNVIIDGVGKWLPLGSLTKIPYGEFGEDFLEKFPTNRELYDLSDHNTRADYLTSKADEGKALRVKEIYASQKVFLKRNADGRFEAVRNEDNSVATQPDKFPVFEWIDAPAE